MSVRSSVCLLSVTCRYSVETVIHIIKRFPPPGSHTVLVFPYQTGASNARRYDKNAIFDQYLALSWCDTRYSYTIAYNGRPIESRTWSIKRRHLQWSWTTPNPVFKVKPLFNAKYLRNGTKYRHSYNEILIGTYALLKNVISNDLEWLSEIFNKTKHRAVCLWQLSFSVIILALF